MVMGIIQIFFMDISIFHPILRTFSMQIRVFVSCKHDKWQGILTVALVLGIFPVSLFSVSPSTNLILFQNPTPHNCVFYSMF